MKFKVRYDISGMLACKSSGEREVLLCPQELLAWCCRRAIDEGERLSIEMDFHAAIAMRDLLGHED